MKYVVCPICGRKLCKCADGSNLEICCPKCEAMLIVSLDKDVITFSRTKAFNKVTN